MTATTTACSAQWNINFTDPDLAKIGPAISLFFGNVVLVFRIGPNGFLVALADGPLAPQKWHISTGNTDKVAELAQDWLSSLSYDEKRAMAGSPPGFLYHGETLTGFRIVRDWYNGKPILRIIPAWI